MKRGVLPTSKGVPLYGYKMDEDKNRVIDEETAKNVRFIFDSYNKGMLLKDIGKKLFDDKIPTPSYYNYLKYGVDEDKWIAATDEEKYKWSISVLGKIISNMQYTGCLILKKTITTSYKTHKRVINKEENQ